MKYVLLLIFCALVFLVCFLVDKLLQKLFPKHELEKQIRRPPAAKERDVRGASRVYPADGAAFLDAGGRRHAAHDLLRRRDDHGRVPTLHIFFRRDLLWGRQLSL